MTRRAHPNVDRAGASGFSMIEALVAIVVLGLGLIPLSTFISQQALQLQQVDRANERHLAQQDILAFVETLNPLADPEGRVELGAVNVLWSSAPLIAPNENVRVGTGLAQFAVGFYRVDVSVTRTDGTPWFDFSVRKTGYRRFSNEVQGFGP
jgi:general secretion pathway protein I